MVIIQGNPPPPFYEVRDPKSNDGIRDPGAGIREDPVLTESSGGPQGRGDLLSRTVIASAAKRSPLNRRLPRGCAPRNDEMGFGSLIPNP